MIDWIDKASVYDGDFAEIGVGVGLTTALLLKTGKKVLGVDPFEDGWSEMPESYGKPYRLEEFEKNINSPNFSLLKVNSLSEEAEIFLSVPLALAYVDGLQYKGAVLNDLRIVRHAKVIIVDDMNRQSGISQVPQAIKEFLKFNNKTLTIQDRWAILT